MVTLSELNSQKSTLSSLRFNYPEAEIEAIFKEPSRPSHQPGILPGRFNKLRSWLGSEADLVGISRRLVTHDQELGIRKIEELPLQQETLTSNLTFTPSQLKVLGYEIKEVLVLPLDFQQLYLRFNVKSENSAPASAIQQFQNRQPRHRHVRLIFRESYQLPSAQIDLSIVFVGQSIIDLLSSVPVEAIYENNLLTAWFKKSLIKYEVEVEHRLGTDFETYLNSLEQVYLQFLDSPLPYYRGQLQTLATSVNSQLGQTNRRGYPLNYFPNWMLHKARDLKYTDLVYGAIVGNKKGNYLATPKADGERRLLIFNDLVGVWLVHPSHIYHRIYEQTDGQWDRNGGTVLDGELIPQSKRRDGAPQNEYWFLIFDALLINGQDVRSLPYFERNRRINDIASNFKQRQQRLYLSTKHQYPLRSVDQFFESIEDLTHSQARLDYETDGIIFTPEFTGYHPLSTSEINNLSISRRVLNRFPDICKWKPPAQLTLDLDTYFQIREDQSSDYPYEKIYIFVYDAKNDRNKPLEFFLQAPWEIELLPDLPRFTFHAVIEYELRYNRDQNRWFLRGLKQRTDKLSGNRLGVVVDVLQKIRDPIAISTLLGSDQKLVYKYHNRIKRRLFRESKKKHSTILDIGAGRGGDISKYWDYDQIIVVEPHLANLEEYQRRVTAYSNQQTRSGPEFAYINQPAQNTLAIMNEVQAALGTRELPEVDLVSLMLSLSFFWSSPQDLDQLVKTIITFLKPEGQIVFLTIDGDAVHQVMRPAFGGLQRDSITLSDTQLTLQNDSTLEIKMPEETIVGTQTEYLVRLMDLSSRLEQEGYELSFIRTANEEFFLYESNRIFTSLYSYGYYTGRPDQEDLKTQKPQKTEELSALPSGLPASITESSKLAPGKPTVNPPGKPTVNPPGKPTVNPPGKPTVNPPGKPTVNPPGKPTVNPPGKPTVNPPGKPMGLPLAQSSGLPQIKKNGLPLPRPKPRAINPPSTFRLPPVRSHRKLNCVQPFQIEGIPGYFCGLDTIGDGNCYLHSILQLISPEYQHGNYYHRSYLARQLRISIPGYLDQIDPQTSLPYYLTGRGSLLNVLAMEVLDPDLIDELKVDYSQAGLTHLIGETSKNIGDEMYSMVSDILGFDIYVINIDSSNRYYLYHHTYRGYDPRESIIILGSSAECHYSSVVYTDLERCYLIFPPDHSVIIALRQNGQMDSSLEPFTLDDLFQNLKNVFEQKPIDPEKLDWLPDQDLGREYLEWYNRMISRES